MKSDASGLIDIRALAEASRREPRAPSKPDAWDPDAIDGLLGIGTGVPFGGALAAPLGPAAPAARDRSVTIALSALIAVVILSAVGVVAAVATRDGERSSHQDPAAGGGPIEATLEPRPPAEPEPVSEAAPAVTQAPERAAEPEEVSAEETSAEERQPATRRRGRRRARTMRRPEAPAPAAPTPPRDRTIEELLDRALSGD
jgi:hypothetical protein